MMKMNKKIAYALSMLAMGGLVSSTVSATVICETEVPTHIYPAAGGSQRMSICSSGSDQATGDIFRTATNTYQLSVKLAAGSSAAHAYIVDAPVGNIVTGCSTTDSAPADGSATPLVQCTASASPNGLWFYVIAD